MSWWRRMLTRPTQAEALLDRELRFHLDQHTDDLVARGMDPEAARRQARLELGGPEQVKEACRDARPTRWLEDLSQDARYAIRALRQRPGFAAVALLTLALGSGATTVMFTVANGVLLKPLPYPDSERIVAVHLHTDAYGDQWGISYPDFLDCQRDCRTLASAAAWTYGGGTISEAGESQYVNGRKISADLFAVLGVPPALGRAFSADEDRAGASPVAIISDRLWQSLYARSADVVGRRFTFDGRPSTIIGVAPAGFRLESEADVFTPLGQDTAPRMRNREANFLHVWARLQPRVPLADAQSELTVVGRRLAAAYPASNAGRGLLAVPLHREVVGEVRSTIWLLSGAVGLVLLIACVNVASLLLARAISREREVAMRVALGATRGRLVRQCLTESAVLALTGGALGVLLAVAGTRPFLALWPGGLPRAAGVQVDWRVLAFAAFVSLGSGVLLGIAPAIRAPAGVEHTLRGVRSTAHSRRAHSVFVMAEIAVAVVLLVAAAMLGRTLVQLSALDPGIDPRNVLITRVAVAPSALADPALIRSAWRDVLERARMLPSVRAAALSDIIPMRVGTNGLGYWTTPAPPPPNTMPIALATSATPDYTAVMNIPVRRGRFFTDLDHAGSEPVVVIDDVLAGHAFGREDPIGKRLFVQAVGPTTVVGVVGHVRHWGLASDDQSPIRDQLYYPLAQVPDRLLPLFSSFMSLAVKTDVPPMTVIEPLRRRLRGRGADQTLYDVRTMEQLARASLDRQRFLLMLFGAFAALAMLLACIGLYGVLAYLTSQRVPEIGVRMALGAKAGDVVWMVLRQSFSMVAIGIGVGMSAGVGAARLLQRFVDGMRPADPVTFAVVIAALATAALVASFVPAQRASRVDPLRALRQD
jgi:predicted permease